MCAGGLSFLKYARDLPISEKPDYAFYKKSFGKLFAKLGYSCPLSGRREYLKVLGHLRSVPLTDHRPTSAPGLAHICARTGPYPRRDSAVCAGTSSHLRQDRATSAPGLRHVCAGTVQISDGRLL